MANLHKVTFLSHIILRLVWQIKNTKKLNEDKNILIKMFARNNTDQTPLHKAAISDNVNVAKFLLDNGAYIDSQDNEKRTPLLVAASANCSNMVRFLVNQNCDIQVKDKKMNTMLHLLINNQSTSSFRKAKTSIDEEKNLRKVVSELITVN